MTSMFDEECWKSTSKPTAIQLENLRRDGLKGGPNSMFVNLRPSGIIMHISLIDISFKSFHHI